MKSRHRRFAWIIAGLVAIAEALDPDPSGTASPPVAQLTVAVERGVALARRHANQPGPVFVDALIDEAEKLALPRGGLTDDIAVLRVARTTA